MGENIAKDPAPLSPAGEARREEMLHELLGEMASVRRARVMRRRATLGVAAAALLGVASWIVVGTQTHGPAPIPSPRLAAAPESNPVPQSARGESARAAAAPGAIHIEIVSTDPSVAERLTIHTELWPQSGTVTRGPLTVTFLDVHGLLRELAAIGRPTGLIEMGGQYQFTRPITDAELGGG